MAYLKEILQNKAKAVSALAIIAVILLFGVPSLLGNQFIQGIVILVLLFGAMTSAWNIIGGYTGQLSLGHASFVGIGAYTAVLLNVKCDVSPWLGMLIAALLAAVAAIIIGWPCFRLKGPFFTLATIAIGEVLRVLAINLPNITFGSVGVSVKMTKFGLASMVFRQPWAYGIMSLILLLIVIFVTRKIENSKMGYYLVAIREDQDAAASLGVNATRIKLGAFAISAAFTAVAGVIYAQYLLYIDPATVLASSLSTQLVLMAIMGGVGTLWGPLLGATLLVPLDQFIRSSLGGTIHGLHLVIYALILIVVILVIPRGIGPTIADWVKKYDRKSENPTSPNEEVAL
jgi:ABC-type branched-chain amino acid transport system, permease component